MKTPSTQNFATQRLAKTLQTTVLWLVCLLPCLVPFSVERNIDIQATLLTITGTIAWLGVFVTRHSSGWNFPRYFKLVLTGYLAFCLLSLLTHPSITNLYGSSLLRLGSLELVACVGCGLLVAQIAMARLLCWLYGVAVVIALTAIPYSLIVEQSLVRLGGVFQQADLLAAWMACGVILGCGLWQLYPKWRLAISAGQITLLGVLLLTQTRAVILLLAFILAIIVLRQSRSWRWRLMTCCGVFIVMLSGVFAIQLGSSHRLTNGSYAAESISYRFSLQSFGLRATGHRLLSGYGAGSLTEALACPTLHNPALQATCHDGYYFNSSHNVFLDRILATGLIGGLAFGLSVILALYKGLRQRGPERFFAYGALLISLYYLTNVTSVGLEALFWIILVTPLRHNE